MQPSVGREIAWRSVARCGLAVAVMAPLLLLTMLIDARAGTVRLVDVLETPILVASGLSALLPLPRGAHRQSRCSN